MKKIIQILFSLLVIVSFSDCKKTFFKSEVKGKVIDEATGNPISGIQVYLLGTTTSLSSSGPSVADQNNSVYTDSEGNFKFEFQRNKYGNNGYALYAKCDPNKYFAYLSSNDMIPLKFEKSFMKEKITKDIYLKPVGYLKLHAKHVSSDTAISVGVYLNGGDIRLLNGNLFGVLYPKYISDTSFVFICNGNENAAFIFSATLRNTSNAYYVYSENQNLFIKAHDTIYYQFNY